MADTQHGAANDLFIKVSLFRTTRLLMKRAAFLLMIVSAADGHAGNLNTAPFTVRIGGSYPTCKISVAENNISFDELRRLSAEQKSVTDTAKIDGDVKNLPYRCLGSVIYILQRSGFKNIIYGWEPQR